MHFITLRSLALCRLPIATSILALAGTAMAQPSPMPAVSALAATTIEYPSVAAARAALEALDGNGAVVTHADGWMIVNEPMAAAQWSFTPPGHYAHPSLVRRVIQRSGGGAVAVQVATLCEAPREACDRLKAEFEAMNERITQSVRARGRQGSTAPPPN